MKKLLYITNIAGERFSVGFCGTSMNACKKLDMEYHVVANRQKATAEQIELDEKQYGIHLHHADISRSPFSKANIKAYKQIVDLVRKEKIDYIHCNTPVGGLLGRLVGKKCKVKKVIYQAHGFHFFKGASKLNWLLYYPIERWLAHMTDALITINQEDYERAKKFRLRKGGKVYYVPGVGIDTTQYVADENLRDEKRSELGVGTDEIVLVSMGDLIQRKNYPVAIKAIAKAGNSKLQYYICGIGPEEDNLKKLAKQLGVEKQVHFLGFRSDIKDILQAADIFLFSTQQEGLSRSLMEAMACGLPCVASKIRGNVDLIEDGKGGFLCDAMDVDAFSEAIIKLQNNSKLRDNMREINLNRIKKFEVSTIEDILKKIYRVVFL